MTTSLVRPFAVVSGAQVHRALDRRERQIVELAEATYRLMVALGSRVRVIAEPDPGPTLGDEPAQGRGLGLVGCQAIGTEGNPPR
jgi:hypothetical protein